MPVKALSRVPARTYLILGLSLLAAAYTGAALPVLAAQPAKQAPSPETPLAASGHIPAKPDAQLTLLVYNYAHIDRASLARSEQVATAIFENVGVTVSWEDCPLSVTLVRAYPACQSEVGTSDIVVKILPRSMAMKLAPTPGYEPLGFARPCPEGEPACDLTVFYYRIEQLADAGYRPDRVLGYVIAHEMTHALIGPGHSSKGIMRGTWSDRDLQRMSLGLLLDFTSEQAGKLRSAALRRAEPETFAVIERTAP